MIREIAQDGPAGRVEPPLHSIEISHTGSVRQIVRQRPDAGEHREEMRLRVGERKLNCLRLWRWATLQQRRVEIQKRGDERSAVAQRSSFDQAHLEADTRIAEQPALALQATHESRELIIVNGAHDLVHEKCLPGTFRRSRYEGEQRPILDEIFDERRAPRPVVDLSAELRVERDQSVQEERCNALVLEMTRAPERVVQRSVIAIVGIDTRPNGIDVAQRDTKLQ
jgi:hypothetical protein